MNNKCHDTWTGVEQVRCSSRCGSRVSRDQGQAVKLVMSSLAHTSRTSVGKASAGKAYCREKSGDLAFPSSSTSTLHYVTSFPAKYMHSLHLTLIYTEVTGHDRIKRLDMFYFTM